MARLGAWAPKAKAAGRLKTAARARRRSNSRPDRELIGGRNKELAMFAVSPRASAKDRCEKHASLSHRPEFRQRFRTQRAIARFRLRRYFCTLAGQHANRFFELRDAT